MNACSVCNTTFTKRREEMKKNRSKLYDWTKTEEGKIKKRESLRKAWEKRKMNTT